MTEQELDQLWDKIQTLKQTDTFAAQILYEKYKTVVSETPPPIPVEVSQLMLPM